MPATTLAAKWKMSLVASACSRKAARAATLAGEATGAEALEPSSLQPDQPVWDGQVFSRLMSQRSQVSQVGQERSGPLKTSSLQDILSLDLVRDGQDFLGLRSPGSEFSHISIEARAMQMHVMQAKPGLHELNCWIGLDLLVH